MSTPSTVDTVVINLVMNDWKGAKRKAKYFNVPSKSIGKVLVCQSQQGTGHWPE